MPARTGRPAAGCTPPATWPAGPATGSSSTWAAPMPQVKIRGFRIEPGEIEAALLAHPAIAAAAVIAREDTPGRRQPGRLPGPRPRHRLPAAAGLRDHLAAALPDYMIPATFTTVDALPLTAQRQTRPPRAARSRHGPRRGGLPAAADPRRTGHRRDLGRASSAWTGSASTTTSSSSAATRSCPSRSSPGCAPPWERTCPRAPYSPAPPSPGWPAVMPGRRSGRPGGAAHSGGPA